MPMTSCEGQPVGNGTPGPVTRRLLAGFGEHVGIDLVAQARAAAAAVASGPAMAQEAAGS
jgi:hypothetical protein